MAARRVQKCYYDEERESFHQECIIAVVNALVGSPVLNDANFEEAYIQSSKASNSNLRLKYYLVLPDGSRHEIPMFFGTRYGNSTGGHINERRSAFSANFTPVHIELVKAIMRLGAMASNGYLTRLRGSARNYEGSAHFPVEQEMLARRFENLQREEAGGGAGGAAYMHNLDAARAEAREVGRNAYMHNLTAAGANVRAAATANYMRSLGAARAEAAGAPAASRNMTLRAQFFQPSFASGYGFGSNHEDPTGMRAKFLENYKKSQAPGKKKGGHRKTRRKTRSR